MNHPYQYTCRVYKSLFFIFLICRVAPAFALYSENFNSNNKAQLGALGWSYAPSSGVSISAANAYQGKSLFSNAGGGNFEMVFSPCMLSNSTTDTLKFAYNFSSATGIFKTGIQNSTNPPGTGITWLATMNNTAGWVNFTLPFAVPAYTYRIVFYVNSTVSGNDKSGLDNIQILHATTQGICNMLPVELVSFTATAQDISEGIFNYTVQLNWQTASELNTLYFVAERSLDANRFDSIATIMANGLSDELIDYTYSDKVDRAVQYFYRLKSVDADGFSVYSKVVTVNAPAAQNWFYTPAEIHYTGNENAIITVYSFSGAEVFRESVSGIATLKLSALIPGIYIVKVQSVATGFQKILIN